MQMNANPENNLSNACQHDTSSSSSSSSASSHRSSSSSPLSSSDGSTSSAELNATDALQSPLTGLLNFEGFSIPQIRNFNISNIDMSYHLPNLPPLPALPSFNMPNFQHRIPDLANNLRINLNLQNFATNMRNFRNLSQFTNNVNNTSTELQNLFNLFRLSMNLPNLPTLPTLPTLPQMPPIFSSRLFTRKLKSWAHLRNSVKNMNVRLDEITRLFPCSFHFKEVGIGENDNMFRIYCQIDDHIYYCDCPKNLPDPPSHSSREQLFQSTSSSSSSTPHNHHQRNSGHHNRRPDRRDSTNHPYDVTSTKPLQPTRLIKSGFRHLEGFDYHPKKCRFVLSTGRDLYYFDDNLSGLCDPPHIPLRIDLPCYGYITDFKICPSNPDIIIFHCSNDIWCTHVVLKDTVNITELARLESMKNTSNLVNVDNRNHQPQQSWESMQSNQSDPNANFDISPTLIGRPSHVMREEFRRYQAFWWRPENECDSKNSSSNHGEYAFLYEETDQSRVDLIVLPSFDGKLEQHRYPKAGRNNAISKLRIARFTVSYETHKFKNITITDVKPNFTQIYPEYEYLVRVGWLGQDSIWCQLMNRRQTHLGIAIISLVDNFEAQIIYEERNDVYWVRVHDIFHILNVTKLDCPLVEGSELAFIWSSEESGFRHLYLIKVRLGGKKSPPRVTMKRQLTDGQWEVEEKDLWVDEDDKLLYFCGLRDTPLEKHLYTLSYADCFQERPTNGKIRIHRLTELNYTHSVIAFNANCSIFTNVQSNISIPPFGFVNLLDKSRVKLRHDSKSLPESKRLALLLVNSFNYLSADTSPLNYIKAIGSRPSIMYDSQADLLPGLAKPELFCCQLTSGELIYGSIFKPEFMESGARYPTVLEIYGGPEIQLVSNNFMGLRHAGRHLLSSEGYVVVLIDCRGSSRRGLSFEAYTYQRMGQVEIADQIEVLKWLSKNTGYIDLNRVAIKGWSYGGYLALMALAQYPKVFKVAIAGAPVVDWSMYDTGYTERFMGLPHENCDGYYKGNILNYVHLFPDEENRLLLLHGLMDENVHFSHTVTLIKALVDVGKPYDLQVFPVEGHLLKSPQSCENYMTYVLSYLQLNL